MEGVPARTNAFPYGGVPSGVFVAGSFSSYLSDLTRQDILVLVVPGIQYPTRLVGGSFLY
jgi:hypothetical protein